MKRADLLMRFPDYQRFCMSTPSLTDDTAQPDRHYALLKDAIAPWLGQASSTRRRALAEATLQAHATNAEFKRLTGVHWNAQNAVDDALNQVQGPRAFARARLEGALLTRFGLDLNSESVFLRLYIPQHVPWFSIPSGAARTWTVSLLDAALHNFEHSETLDDTFEIDSTYITPPNATGQFDTLPAIREKIGITTFTRLCRELDIGAHYQTYLRTQLGLNEPVSAAVLQAKVDASHKAALRVALQLARQRGDIRDDFARQVEGLLQGRSDLSLDTQPLHCHTLQMMDAPLAGILLIAPDLETSRSVQRLVAYVPDDPQQPLKEYASALAFQQELTHQLRDPDYQTFFSRFVPHAQRGVFFANLSQRLARVKWHPTDYGSGLPAWRKEPTDAPKLQFVATLVHGNIWLHLYQQKLNQVLNDARTQAVSTATVDRNARWALWDSFVNVASSILNAALLIVAPFIPGLGELMLGYMAYQLLDDVFEGIVDWAEGLSQEAFGHLMSVLQSLVQLGAFGAGSTIGAAQLRRVLPPDVLAFIDRFKPVTLASGARRYWQPDLTPYQQHIRLPPRLGIDSQGLHRMRGESILPLEGKLYAVQKHANEDTYVIKHPNRPEAYTPRVQHNGAGAWHSELDTPLQWDHPTLLRRLGHRVAELSEADQQLALSLSGVNENALRQMHVRSDPVPPLLDDTLDRLRLDRSLQTLIERLDSDDPTQHAQVDPQDMLQLLTTYGDWPDTRALRIVDAEGNTAWAFGDQNKPVVQIHEAQMTNGDLLRTLLQALSPEEIRRQFGEVAADPELRLENRVKQLRKKLARLAERHRTELFEARYAEYQLTEQPPVQHMMQTAPGLPTKLITRLLGQASAFELEELGYQRTPPRLAHLAESALAELRLNRAYEGQHLVAPPNLDTDRLALNSLKLLPGWSDQLRLDARHLDAAAASWLQVGPDDAPIQRTVVRTAGGRYVPYDDKGPLFGETDLYTAVLNALPDAQRDALGIGIGQGPLLEERLRHNPLKRDELRHVLGGDAAEPPSLETQRHLGSDSGYPRLAAPATQPPTLEQRARQLYPALNPRQIHDLLTHLHAQPSGVANGLAALAEEYGQLDRDLSTWERQPLTTHPGTGAPLSDAEQVREAQNRYMSAKQLRQCWRRETDVDDYFEAAHENGHSLRMEYPILGPLPELTANFDHVSLLTLYGFPDSPGAVAFIGRFWRLRHLSVTGFNLGTLPETIFSMPRLNALNLSTCNIRLTPASQARLGSLHGLQILALHNNPLGLAPSVEAMPHLIHLDLTQAAIEHLPAGVLTRPELQVVLLNDNQIRELPAELFTLSPERADSFVLSDNPLSRRTLEQVKTYYQLHGVYFDIDAPAADLRDARLLYPSLSQEELNQFIYKLPGNLEDGQIELANRAGELQQLQTELTQWQQAPDLSPTEYRRRNELSQLLENSWRRERTQPTGRRHSLVISRRLAGHMPTLKATWRHVAQLVIEDGVGLGNVDAFLARFPELHVLNVHQAQLTDIPQAVFGLPKLWFLELENCSIKLSANSRASLENMQQLRHLSLSGNPLGELPDFSQLPELGTLLLTDTGLSAVPPGLLRTIPRQVINLSRNAIEHLPATLFELPVSSSQAFDLSANPLSYTSLEQIKRYCQRTQAFFNAQAPAAQREWAQRLYPRLQPRDADGLIFKLAGNMDEVDAALTRLEAEYQQLVSDLQRWADDVPTRHPVLGNDLDDLTRIAEEGNRSHFKRLLEEAWRRESPEDEESLDYTPTHAVLVNLPIIGELPPLSARFEHVTAFEFKGSITTTQVDGTLKNFTELQSLNVSHCTLERLPTAIFAMPKLTSLELSHCAIRLTPATARTVSDLHSLEFLDLSNNPLGRAPDVTGLQRLTSLHLHNTRISQLPDGVFQLTELQNLDLSHNQLREIPQALMETQQNFHDESDLSNNPWSRQSLDRLRQYYVQTGIDFQVHEITVDGNGDPVMQLPEEPMEE